MGSFSQVVVTPAGWIVSRIRHKPLEGFQGNLVGGRGTGQGTNHYIWGPIRNEGAFQERLALWSTL